MRTLLFAYGFTGAEALASLIEKDFDICGIVTAPVGINRYRYSLDDILPVETLAIDQSIPIYNTNNGLWRMIEKDNPELIVISTYDRILQKEMLKGRKVLNVHHGDLPRWRGSSSSEWAVISGRNECAITIHEVTPELDNGKIYFQRFAKITDDEDIRHLRKKMKEVIYHELGDVINGIIEGKIQGIPQDSSKATYTCSIRDEDSLIDWKNPTDYILRWIRGLCDEGLPHAHTYHRGKRLDILTAEKKLDGRIYECSIAGKPVMMHPNGVEVLTGSSNLYEDEYSTLLLKDIIFNGKIQNANEVIKSIRNTLGGAK